MSELIYTRTEDGLVHHGARSLVKGQEITEAEYRAICASKRQDVPAPDAQPDTRDARIAQLEADVSKLLSLLANGGQ